MEEYSGRRTRYWPSATALRGMGEKRCRRNFSEFPGRNGAHGVVTELDPLVRAYIPGGDSLPLVGLALTLRVHFPQQAPHLNDSVPRHPKASTGSSVLDLMRNIGSRC